MATQVHPLALVEKGAELDEDVIVGPFCVVGPKVKVGKGTVLDSHVVVEGRTEIGPNCRLSSFACIGKEPQDLKYKGEDTGVLIGANNVMREYVTVHRGSVGGDGMTRVGADNFLMAYVHVAHDCVLHSNVILASYVALGGHVIIEDHVFIGGLVGVHQHVRVGTQSMVGGLTRVATDIPPYMMAVGADDPELFGPNIVGLRRRGFSNETINELKSAHKILFKSKLTLKSAIKKVQEELPYTDEIKYLVEFLQESKRGFIK